MTDLSRRDALSLALAAATRPTFTAAAQPPPARPRRVRLYGTDKPLPRRIPLQAGPLTLLFEPELAQIRYVRLGDREVIRAIYAAVRDRNWGTVTPHIANLRTETTGHAFALTFDVACIDGPIDFLWRGSVKGESDGSLRFDFEGTARSTFLRNRLGFCVLHPVDGCAGDPVTIGKADGTAQRGVFPADISPHQPFMDIRSIRHTVQPGVDALVTFEGDVFEMEDHRNWTDASFKTYCTPLGLPFPVEVKQGTTVKQSVTLRLIGSVPEIALREPEPELALRIRQAAAVPLPAIGLGIAQDSPALTAREVQRLRAVNLAHLRVDLRPGGNNWRPLLARAAAEANAVGAALEVALTLGPKPETELEQFASALASVKLRVARVLVFHQDEKSTGSKWMAIARRVLPSLVLASGTDAYFTELNRGRPPVAESDAVCYSVNPQVHAFDNASLVETLPMQAATVRSARKFCGKLPVSVTPVTLKPRFNPNATGAPAGGIVAQALPEQVDPRQMSLFAAAWTLGSVKYLAEAGAASVTYYETTGWRGIMETEQGCPLPALFYSRPGEVFPLYHVLAAIGAFAGGEVLPTISPDPLRIEALLLRKGARRRLLLANFTPDLQQVRVPGASLGRTARIAMLDENSTEHAMEDPEWVRRQPGTSVELTAKALAVSLLPCAVAIIDLA